MKVCLYLSVLYKKLVLSAWCSYIQVLPPISLSKDNTCITSCTCFGMMIVCMRVHMQTLPSVIEDICTYEMH